LCEFKTGHGILAGHFQRSLVSCSACCERKREREELMKQRFGVGCAPDTDQFGVGCAQDTQHIDLDIHIRIECMLKTRNSMSVHLLP
jgi:hypothetical protein